MTNLTFVSFAICSHPFLFNCQFSKLLHSYSIQKEQNVLKNAFHKNYYKKQEVSQVLADFLFLFNYSAKLAFNASTLSVCSQGKSISVRPK